jgi:hypothetical protein
VRRDARDRRSCRVKPQFPSPADLAELEADQAIAAFLQDREL